MRRAGIGLGVLVFVLALDFVWKDAIADSSLRQLLMLAACNVLVALSLNVINGMAGQFSIGHAGFVGMGAYASAMIFARSPRAWSTRGRRSPLRRASSSTRIPRS